MYRQRIASLLVAFSLFATLITPGTGLCAQGGRKAQAVVGKKAAGEPGTKKAPGVETAAGEINARAAVLMEVSTGTVLLEYNADDPIEPASFTKILSLYLIFEGLQQGRIHLNDEIYVSENAWRTGGSKMFVGVGSKVPLDEILKGIAVVSGNDACVAAAEHLYGSSEAFVEAMNQKAKELGANQSRFMNPHGLPADGQITTARDMAKIDLAYLQRFPESLRYHSMQEYTYNNIVQYNRNHLLLKDPSVDGLKTGFVNAGGYHLSATAKRDGMRLLAVVMGAPNPATREREALKLLNYGFRTFTLVQPFPDGQPLATLKVWKGVKDDLGLYPQENPAFLIPQAQKNLLRWEVRVPSDITAPVASQQNVGEVIFYISDQAKKNIALVSREEIDRAGIFKRAWQSVINVGSINWKWVGGVIGGISILGALMLFVSGRRSSRRRTFS